MESSLEENSFVFMQAAGHSTSSLESGNRMQSLDQKPKQDLDVNNGKSLFTFDDSYIPSDDTSVNFCRSFVVLGKSSMDAIQASSLASYDDIEQKSMSIDCNSVIASWNSSDVHDKLNELIRENEKLKETLKQNNMAMKQQFNSVASWQEEIMKAHQNHKKKFAETRELINRLKEENAELKSKIISRNDSLVSAYEMPSTNEIQSCEDKKSLISETELQKSLSADNSELKYKIPSFDAEKLVSTLNLISSQLKQTISTIQEQSLAIKEVKAQHAVSESYNSNDLKQSIAHNTPEHVKAMDECTRCKKCLSKHEDTNSLTEVDFIHELQCHCKTKEPEILQSDKSLDNCQKSQNLESCSISNRVNIELLTAQEMFHLYAKYVKLFISKLRERVPVGKEEMTEDIKKANVTTESFIDVTESIEKNAGDKHLQEQVNDLITKTKNLEEEKQKIECQRKNLEMDIIKLSAEKGKCEARIVELVTEVGNLHETIQNKQLEIDTYKTNMTENEQNLESLISSFENDFRLEYEQKMLLSEEKSRLQNELDSKILLIQELLSQFGMRTSN